MHYFYITFYWLLRILMGSIKNVSFSGEDSRVYFHFPSLLSVTFTIIRTCFQSHIHYRYKWHFTFHIQYQPITVKKCILCISVEKICFILTTGRSVCLSIESKFSSIFILSEMFNQCHHVICDHPAHRYETLESNVPKLHISDNNTRLFQQVPSSPQYFLHGCEVWMHWNCWQWK